MVQRLGAALIEGVTLEMQGVYEDVATMKSRLPQVGAVVMTINNSYGVPSGALWKIGTAAQANTFSHQLSTGKYANLIPRAYEEYASFDFGHTTDANINLAATTEAHRVANANPKMCSLEFPTGSYPILTTLLDVARRGFRFAGKGFDITTLNYVGPDLGDSVVLVLNDVTPALTRLHFYQILEELTINGGMEQSKYASSVAINGHYPRLNFKSVGHFYANVDLNGLSCSRAFIHSQGRPSPTNPAFATRVGVSFNYNAWDVTGYLSNGIAGRACIKIDAKETTLAVATAIGDTTMTLTNAADLRRHFILEVDPSGGDATLEAPSIKSVSGNVVTLVSPLTKAHAAGVVVRMTASGINITGAQLETGDVLLGNCNNVNITGNYFEGAKPVITGYPRKLNVSQNVIAEVDALIDKVNRNSEIRYRDNEQSFPLRINVANRSGSIDSFLDLYNMPLLDVGGLNRKEGSITVNETDSDAKNGYYFQDLRVRDTYDRAISGTSFRVMDFEGLFASVPAAGNVNALSMYNIIPAGGNFNGYTFDIHARMHRQTSVVPGVAHVIATAYNQNGTPGAENKTVASLYSTYWNDTTGVRIQAGATTSRANLVCFGEATGGQVTSFTLRGCVSMAV